MNLYHDLLLDHYRNPRHKLIIDGPHFASEEYNPSCGDRVSFTGLISEQTITKLCFQGTGCVISLATASLLTEAAQGKSVDEITTWNAQFVLDLIGMQLGPTRLKCALLPLQALQSGLSSCIKK